MSIHKPDNIKPEGILIPKDAFVVMVKTEWNSAVVDELEKGCKQVLDEYGVRHQTIIVPGAFEIPFGIKNHSEKPHSPKPNAYIALGCIIKGDTPHFDFVSKAVTDGVLHLNLLLKAPTVFGVLTVDNIQQAQERIGGNHGHKGEEAAITALKMIALSHS